MLQPDVIDAVGDRSSRLIGAAAIRTGPDRKPVLLGCCCRGCANEMVPPVAVCPVCGGDDMTSTVQPREGMLYSYTVVYVGPATWRRPLRLGYVDLPNGVRVFTHLEGETFAIGDPVELDLATIGRDPDGTDLVGYVFKRRGEAS